MQISVHFFENAGCKQKRRCSRGRTRFSSTILFALGGRTPRRGLITFQQRRPLAKTMRIPDGTSMQVGLAPDKMTSFHSRSSVLCSSMNTNQRSFSVDWELPNGERLQADFGLRCMLSRWPSGDTIDDSPSQRRYRSPLGLASAAAKLAPLPGKVAEIARFAHFRYVFCGALSTSGLSIADTSEVLGVRARTIRRWLNGEVRPCLPTMVGALVLLHWTSAELQHPVFGAANWTRRIR